MNLTSLGDQQPIEQEQPSEQVNQVQAPQQGISDKWLSKVRLTKGGESNSIGQMNNPRNK